MVPFIAPFEAARLQTRSSSGIPRLRVGVLCFLLQLSQAVQRCQSFDHEQRAEDEKRDHGECEQNVEWRAVRSGDENGDEKCQSDQGNRQDKGT